MIETEETPPPKAPSGLSTRARRLWRNVVDAYVLSDAELEVLRGALECLDRADAAARVVRAEGVTVLDRYGAPKAHPAIDVELRARGLFNRAVAQLGVKIDDGLQGRGGRPRPQARERG